MGSPQFSRKLYETPKKPYDSVRLKMESEIKSAYGLKSKREIWKAHTTLRNYRQQARRLLALHTDQGMKESKEIIEKLKRLNILKEGATLDDILGLKVEDFLERRLQTVVYKRGMANTQKQARQFIIHGNIAVNGRKITSPSYVVTTGETEKIEYYKRVPDLREESDLIEVDNLEGLDLREKKDAEKIQKLEEGKETAKKEEVKEEVKEEPKEAVKEEPKEAVKGEVKEEPKEAIKGEVKEEPKEAVKGEVKEEVKEEPKETKPAEKPETVTKGAGE